MGYDTVEDYITGEWDKIYYHRDANDMLSLIATWQACDLGNNPVYGGDTKPDREDDWLASTRVRQPVLTWEYALAGDSVGAAAPVSWDLEIYDESKPVYRAQRLTSTSFNWMY